MKPIFNGTLLDDRERCVKIDPSGMLTLIEGLPRQCQEAVDIARRATLPNWQGIGNIVVLGMGGSAIGGNLARSLFEAELKVPFAVNSEYTIPAYVGENTLVIASSYSGNTEESLAGYVAARARRARILVISSGGELARRAQADGNPWIQIPGGIQPRAALGYSFFPLIVVLSRLGLISPVDGRVEEAIRVLEALKAQLAGDVPFHKNAAKQLAAALAGKIALIYGSGGWRAMAAYRWKCQVNENSKALCFWNTFPELNHNETVGWEYPETASEVYVVNLRDPADHPRLQKRVQVTQELMESRVAGQSEVWAAGESSLARLMSLIYPGDFTSCYLAILYGVDPTPVKMIDRLKDELATLSP